MKENNNPHNISSFRKILAMALVIFALFLLGIWAFQFSNNLSSDRYLSSSEEKNTPKESGCSSGSCSTVKSDNNNNKDTDNDGLSDTEEREKYDTSPYIKDTDGDGISDKQEIEQGTDPNCPQGKQCSNALKSGEAESQQESFQSSLGSNKQTTNTSSDAAIDVNSPQQQSNNLLSNQNLSAENVSQDILKKVMGGGADMETLRKFLIQAGAKKSMVDQVSDEKLKQSYQKALNSVQQ